MDLSSACSDYIDFRWPEGVEIFAAAHPFDDMSAAELSQQPQEPKQPAISNPADASPIPTAPGQLVLNLEFGKSYLYVALCIWFLKLVRLLNASCAAYQLIQNTCMRPTPVFLLKLQRLHS